MKFKIIKRIPKYSNAGLINPEEDSGEVQNVNSNISVTSEPEEMSETFVGPDGKLYFSNQQLAPAGMSSMTGLDARLTDPVKLNQQFNSDVDAAFKARAVDGNPLDPMTFVLDQVDQGPSDIFGYADRTINMGIQTGAALGKAFKKVDEDDEEGLAQRNKARLAAGVGLLGTAASGVAAGMGIARGIATHKGQLELEKDMDRMRRDRMHQEQMASFVQFRDGGTYLGDGRAVNASSLVGDKVYPLPKSAEGRANVEMEDGEYIFSRTKIEPQRVTGEKHSNGGVKLDVQEPTFVVSNHRKISQEEADMINSMYPEAMARKDDTYARVMERCEKKIGLQDKYKEQASLMKKLQKNQSVSDENTSMLNKEVLSKGIHDFEEEMKPMKARFRGLAEFVYKLQEDGKKAEVVDKFFMRNGGKFDMKMISKSAKASGIKERDALNAIYDAYYKNMYQNAIVGMPGGGSTENMLKALRMMKDMGVSLELVDVAGADRLRNGSTNKWVAVGPQHKTGAYTYGNAEEADVDNFLKIHKTVSRDDLKNANRVKEFQTDYTSLASLFNNLVMAEDPVFSNAKDFDKLIGSGFVDSADDGSARMIDGKLGQYTLSRHGFQINMMDPETLNALNNAGMTNFSDLYDDNGMKKEASDILSKAGFGYADVFDQMRKTGDWLDFIIGERGGAKQAPSIPEFNAVDAPMLNFEEEDINLPDIERSYPTENSPNQKTPVVSSKKSDWLSDMRRLSSGMIRPEMLVSPPQGITFEGMQRHVAPQIDPVTQSADQYLEENARQLQSSFDAIGDVPDSQRAAMLSSLNAASQANINKVLNDVNYQNAEQISKARQFNALQYAATDDKNIAERQRWEAGVLKSQAIYDENLARYYDYRNDEMQQKLNAAISKNALSSVYPDVMFDGSGRIINVNTGEIVYGDTSTQKINNMLEAYKYLPRSARSTGSTTKTGN